MVAAPQPKCADRTAAAAGWVRRVEPSPELLLFVEGYYLYERAGCPRWVLPNGAVELLLGLRDSGRDGRRVLVDPFLLHAHLGRCVRMPSVSTVTVLSVRFRPGGFRPFVGVSMARLAGRVHRLSGSELLPWVARLGLREPGEYLDELEGRLSERLRRRSAPAGRPLTGICHGCSIRRRSPIRQGCGAPSG